MKNVLKHFSKEELAAELARRDAPIPTPPPMLEEIPIGRIGAWAHQIVHMHMSQPGALSDDAIKSEKHALFEIVLEAYYGKDIWTWWNSRLEARHDEDGAEDEYY